MKQAKKSIFKMIAVSFVAIFLLAGLAGCSEDDKKDDKSKESSSMASSSMKESSKKEDSSKESTEMSEKALDTETKDEFTKKAEDDIKLLNEDKIDEVKNQFETKFKDEFVEKDENELKDIIKKAGTFDKIENVDVKEDGNMIETMTKAKYNDADLTFTISYDKDNKEIVGLYVK